MKRSLTAPVWQWPKRHEQFVSLPHLFGIAGDLTSMWQNGYMIWFMLVPTIFTSRKTPRHQNNTASDRTSWSVSFNHQPDKKGSQKKAQHGVQRNQQAPTTMNWHLSSYHPFPPSLFWILRILSASLVNILGTSLKVLQDCKTGRFISILTPACLLEQKQQGVLQLQLRLCFTEMYRNVKILHVYEDRLQTSLLPRARTSHSKFHHCSGLIEIGRIRQPLDQKFFLASIQPPGLLESLMLDVLMSTFDSVLSSFATSLYSFQSECITTSWPSPVRACLWR